MKEYLRLTGVELRLGKLILRQFANGIGSIFPVAKPHGRRRAVWHGILSLRVRLARCGLAAWEIRQLS